MKHIQNEKMKIKQSTFISGVVTTFFVIFLNSCESHEQKSAEAFEEVKKTKQELTDTLIPAPPSIEPAKDKKIPDEWEVFSLTIEETIRKNERKIKEAKGIPNQNGKILGDIVRLEKSNNDLKVRMDEYHEDSKVRWEKFKAGMFKDAETLTLSLKNLNPKQE